MKLFIEIRKGETVDKLPRFLAFIVHTADKAVIGSKAWERKVAELAEEEEKKGTARER